MSVSLHFYTVPPLSLYVHIPWCVRKCPYCDFNSHAIAGEIPESDYTDGLLTDLDRELERIPGRQVQSIFIGGGTPSLFSPRSIEHLLAGIRRRLAVLPDAEITMEVNPGTIEQERFAEFRAAGVNRLSIGIQSFQPTLLVRIGRIHGAEQAVRAAKTVHRAGFENFNLDLMFGLPGQQLSQALDDLRLAMEFKPTHISWYQLTIEPNTRFHRCPPQLPLEDTIWDMQVQGQQLLDQNGYRQYEVSAHARDARYCRHNVNYWRFGDYLGIGAGAHGKLTDIRQHTITRTWKSRHPMDYLARAQRGSATAGERTLAPADVVLEFVLNGLRLTGGFNRSLFERVTGLPFNLLQERLTSAEQAGLIDPVVGKDALVRPTALGRRFLNDLVAGFLPEEQNRVTGRTA